MKLQKFTKNKKQKQIVIGSIIGILLLIGGISLYRTFALYKVEQTFNVLNGTIPDFSSGDVTLALKVDGQSTEDIPNKGGNYAIQVDCDRGNGVWNMDSWGIEINNIEKSKVKCNIEFTTLKENSSIFNFDYTGKEEAISLPSGKYKLEVWGAQGGIDGANQEENIKFGGLGGYSKGDITLSSSNMLYINVGGQGSNQKEDTNEVLGGYNGGGKGYNHTSGGGATHIALVSGLLSTLEAHKDDGKILIVAGGGGGNSKNDNGVSEGYYSFGGSGGGYAGGNGVNSHEPYMSYYGTGGNQEQGGYNSEKETEIEGQGKFGLGGNYLLTYTSGSGSGGGGGYYGGGGSSRHHAGAGGGSGYLSPFLSDKGMWCYQCDQDTNENTKTTSTNNVSSEPKSEFAKQGNGYARITYLENL